MDLEKIREIIKEKNIHTIRIEFPDHNGLCKGKLIPASRFEAVCEEGINCSQATFSIDLASGIPAGTGTAEEVDFVDMNIIPDLNTFTTVPYQPGLARVIGDIYFQGKPFPYSPRWLLKNVIAEYEKLGYEPIAATELEFFVFTEGGKSLYQNRPACVYMSGVRVDPQDLMITLQNNLLEMGLDILYLNHEYFNSQYEVNGQHANALKMADHTFVFKQACKDIAFQKGLFLTFMGRPKDESGGSGYHLHFSLNDKKTGKNAFNDPSAPNGINDLMKSFIAGQLRHARAMTPFMAPTINSYKRYVPGSFAPYFITWGMDNRTTYIRVPNERGNASRVENRSGCASANPYFAIALPLIAGLMGIKEKLDPGAPFVGDSYSADPEQYNTVPLYLHEAVAELEKDKALCEAIGPEIIKNYTVLKKSEAEKFRAHVTEWEFNEYAFHL